MQFTNPLFRDTRPDILEFNRSNYTLPIRLDIGVICFMNFTLGFNGSKREWDYLALNSARVR